MSALHMYSSSLSTVTLVPVGDIRVCKGNNQGFMCSSAEGVLWTISGFSSGISDTDNPVNPFIYERDNVRVKTNDTRANVNPSSITFQNLGYADDNAVVTCLNSSAKDARMSTIQIGESTFHTIHTVGGFHLYCPVCVLSIV